jgi:glycosyltransferase involved in cell wall biosynthesis
MKVSVIMPVYLGKYDGSATNREDKFIRSINSFLANTLNNSELIIVSDDCFIAKKIVYDVFFENISQKRIKYIHTKPKSKLFSGELRSVGIKNADGEYICYLDSDDIIGEKHLETIVLQIEAEKLDWAYYNDYIYTPNGFIAKTVFVQHESIGTSSIIHKNKKKLDWKNCNGYGHDWLFVQKLQKWSNNFDKIYGASYFICHIPNQIDY